jgi:micrococcal nuclease
MTHRRFVGLLTAFVMVLAGLLALLQYAPWVPVEGPALPSDDIEVTIVGDVSDTGRTSERYQIVDDTVGAEIDATGDTIATNATVTEVADGDTLTVVFDDGTEARIRMLGVDTPETVDPRKPVQCFGKEASDFTKGVLTDARVRLDPDPLADERDVYGRLLRNVTTEDGTDFNAQLIAEGYAHAYLSFPLDPVRKKQLADLEAQAKAEQRGLWGEKCTST